MHWSGSDLQKNHFVKCATFKTGLSDHHKQTTILRKTISKGNYINIFCSDYKRFDQKKFETEQKLKLNSQKKLNYSTFQALFQEILNKIASVKTKFYVLTTMPLWLYLSEKQ